MLSASEIAAATQLGASQATWDPLFRPTRTFAVTFSPGMRQLFGALIEEGELFEQRARQVRAHPISIRGWPSNHYEGGVCSTSSRDCELQARREVRLVEQAGSSAEVPCLGSFPSRLRAWEYYDMTLPTAPATDTRATASFGVGAHVFIVGLSSRPDLNSERGEVITSLNARGRLGVRVQSSGEEVAVRPVNLLGATAVPASPPEEKGLGPQLQSDAEGEMPSFDMHDPPDDVVVVDDDGFDINDPNYPNHGIDQCGSGHEWQSWMERCHAQWGAELEPDFTCGPQYDSDASA